MIKKTLTLVFIFLTVLLVNNETSGQDTTLLPLDYFKAVTSPSINSPELGSPYLTHPEFTGLMTTTIITPAQNTAEGYIFVSPVSQGSNGPPAIMVLDNNGEPVYIKPLQDDKFGGDFKKQTVNGIDYLTYHSGIQPGGFTHGTSYVLDKSYELVDTWTIDIGEGSDVHDFLLLDNGHAISMAYVPIPFDLSPYGGPVNGLLVDIVLQEQDANKNVVFEWRGSEHMPIGDTEIDLNTTGLADFLHTNAIAVDDDGNWLLSHRHFSEITKIDRQTGDIIWRMGGAGNEFTFTNDIGFSNQHDIVRLNNGNISLFDNGNNHNPPHSRAIEYAIDEEAKTVTRVWMYPDDMSELAVAMGNFQRLPNGNAFIGWGTDPKFTEVEPDGTVALEMVMSTTSYRAFRFPWSGTPAEAPRAVLIHDSSATAVTLYTSWNGATDITSYEVYAGPTIDSMAVVDDVLHDGFETTIPLTGLAADTCFFQIKPVHAEGNSTPFSNLMYRLDLPICWDQLAHSYLPVMIK